jgi:hypothetical protein
MQEDGLGRHRLPRRRSVKINHAISIGALVIALGTGCAARPEAPPGTLSVTGLLADPVYDTEVMVYGEVRDLGELLCPCFTLMDDGERLEVWYDLMVADDGAEWPAVSVTGIENGDTVVVTGQLRRSQGALLSRTFWATRLEKAD